MCSRPCQVEFAPPEKDESFVDAEQLEDYHDRAMVLCPDYKVELGLHALLPKPGLQVTSPRRSGAEFPAAGPVQGTTAASGAASVPLLPSPSNSPPPLRAGDRSGTGLQVPAKPLRICADSIPRFHRAG